MKTLTLDVKRIDALIYFLFKDWRPFLRHVKLNSLKYDTGDYKSLWHKHKLIELCGSFFSIILMEERNTFFDYSHKIFNLRYLVKL